MEDKTSSLGLWTQANDFHSASCVLANSDHSHLIGPSYYLVLHSIELALKAYLRGYGFSLESLNKLSCDLRKTLNNAINSNLNSYIKLSAVDLKAISSINEYYKNKGLQYMASVDKSYPSVQLLAAIGSNLLVGIKQFCFDEKAHHLHKSD